ncbi:DNA packaging protein [Loigolactobacillus backii]|uniref:DNA packaging protein n=1 Tax=Loigolactobacillus backii TaxID=375175 RepID=A0A192H4Q8_9LACO|nr:head-tail connector protein [Loigolactobacillus backii]ANK63365.1 DNA packaging protein [Loigolactobacillus backii]ANK69630.1 DNA packaging protein [Loigolactobacillus backii]
MATDETTSAANLETLKLSLRIDGTADDGLLNGYLAAAKSFVESGIGSGADVSDFYSQTNVVDLFNTAVLALASTYYTYRTSLSAIAAIPVDLTVNSIIGQLRGLYAEQSEVTDDGESN